MMSNDGHSRNQEQIQKDEKQKAERFDFSILV